MDIYTESITPVNHHRCRWRVWRQESSYDDPGAFTHEEVEAAIRQADDYFNLEDVKKVLALDRVDAVECVDQVTGRGVMLYKDWP